MLPAVTWQGENPFDSDLDGFADTLETARSFPADRPFQNRAVPARFNSEISPLLRFLDRERLAYDITTDIALARREGPSLANAPGVAFAGTTKWLPRRVSDGLRDEVEKGLRVVSFGGQSLKRTVALVGGRRLANPSSERPDDVFGERTQTFRADLPAPLRTETDKLGLLKDVDPFFGEFSVFEGSERLPAAGELLTSAGREEGEPAFVAYRLGTGTVIRPGTPQWARELTERRLSVEVPNITERIWRFISRR